MKLSPNGRFLLAMLLLAPGALAIVMWGFGWAFVTAGRELWMAVHKACRAPNCVCGECREFDPEFVAQHLQASAAEPPAAT